MSRKKTSQDMAGFGCSLASELVNGARDPKAGLCNDGSCEELRVFWLNWGKPLHPDPIVNFKSRIHTSKLDNQSLCRGNPQRMRSENLPPAGRGLRPGGSNLSRYVLVEHWPWARVSF